MPENNSLPPDWLSGVRALHSEQPAGAMARVRIAWPDIQIALRQGHTLRVIHQRLSNYGLQIPYSTLARYLNRLRYADSKPRIQTVRCAGPLGAHTLAQARDSGVDPFAGALAALSKPRYDIREAMANGDPRGKSLI